jgi:hypothetical protein
MKAPSKFTILQIDYVKDLQPKYLGSSDELILQMVTLTY